MWSISFRSSSCEKTDLVAYSDFPPSLDHHKAQIVIPTAHVPFQSFNILSFLGCCGGAASLVGNSAMATHTKYLGRKKEKKSGTGSKRTMM